MTTEVENFPGFREGVQGHGPDGRDAGAGPTRFGAEILPRESSTKADLSSRPYRLRHRTGRSTPATPSYIIATGRQRQVAGPCAPRMRSSPRKGCAASPPAPPAGTDSSSRGKEIAVVGGGDTALDKIGHLPDQVRLQGDPHAIAATKFRASQTHAGADPGQPQDPGRYWTQRR